jgi:hypothetical protein
MFDEQPYEPCITCESADEIYIRQLKTENVELKRQLAEREWISVEDRLPDNDDSVLVFYLGGARLVFNNHCQIQ